MRVCVCVCACVCVHAVPVSETANTIAGPLPAYAEAALFEEVNLLTNLSTSSTVSYAGAS